MGQNQNKFNFFGKTLPISSEPKKSLTTKNAKTQNGLWL